MKLADEIRNCSICADALPLPPRPIIQLSKHAKILIVGQAPGIKAHETQKPWNDASGERLRKWLMIDESSFYDRKKIAIVPMGFCYPGRASSGDLPPRPECRIRWMDTILCYLKEVQLTILVGSYAAEYFLGSGNLTDKIKDFALNEGSYVVLPHPSPRNNIWLSKNLWFEEKSIHLIREKIKKLSL